MTIRTLMTAAAALLATASGSYATTPTIQIQATYSGSATETSGKPGYAPTVTAVGLNTPFTETLTLGTRTAQSTFISVNPQSGASTVGTIEGAVSVTFAFTEPTGTITGVTTTAGAATASITGGSLKISANYELFYGTSPQTDCLVWSTATTCTANGVTNVISDTAVVTFSDGAVIDVNLYNWSDWNMTPGISFTYVSQPTNGITATVPEPASIALLGAGLAGLGLVARRRNGSKKAKTN